MEIQTNSMIKFVAGSFLLVLGIALTLFWWQEVTVLFRGSAGIALALIGLLILYTIK